MVMADGLAHYELRAVVAAPPRVAPRARNAEPRELFDHLLDGIVACGFGPVGEVSVRPIRQCPVCGVTDCETHQQWFDQSIRDETERDR